MPPDVVGKQDEVFLRLPEGGLAGQHGCLDDLPTVCHIVELLGDFQCLHAVIQLVRVDVAQHPLGTVAQDVVTAILQNVPAERHRLAQRGADGCACRAPGGLIPCRFLCHRLGIQRQHLRRLQPQGAAGRYLCHGPAQQFQCFRNPLRLQQCVYLPDAVLHAFFRAPVGVAEQFIHADAEEIRNGRQVPHVRVAHAGFPS